MQTKEWLPVRVVAPSAFFRLSFCSHLGSLAGHPSGRKKKNGDAMPIKPGLEYYPNTFVGGVNCEMNSHVQYLHQDMIIMMGGYS